MRFMCYVYFLFVPMLNISVSVIPSPPEYLCTALLLNTSHMEYIGVGSTKKVFLVKVRGKMYACKFSDANKKNSLREEYNDWIKVTGGKMVDRISSYYGICRGNGYTSDVLIQDVGGNLSLKDLYYLNKRNFYFPDECLLLIAMDFTNLLIYLYYEARHAPLFWRDMSGGHLMISNDCRLTLVDVGQMSQHGDNALLQRNIRKLCNHISNLLLSFPNEVKLPFTKLEILSSLLRECVHSKTKKKGSTFTF